ncbi:MAG: hypothetical protein IJW49_01720 [Clostridia bacterium]|nr:hypothetical protein [Clostridia bacterium]
MSQKKNKSSYSWPVRILTIILTAVIASGALIYLITLLINLFGGDSGSTLLY